MAYLHTGALVGLQPIAETSTTQKHPLGLRVIGRDATLGYGEFIYLTGVASTVVGDLVTYNTSSWTTTRAAVGTNKPQPIAVAMSANVASQYGWYQISGVAVCSKSATISLAAGVVVGVKSVARVSVTGSGKEVQGAIVAAVASAATGRITVQVLIDRPHLQGRVT